MAALNPEIGRCPNCSTPIRQDHPYAWCSECGNGLPQELRPKAHGGAAAERPADSGAPRVMVRHFGSSFKTWDALFAEAAAFATQIGRGRLISISHSEDHSKGVVTVWYWSA
jgi:hypothetical protein